MGKILILKSEFDEMINSMVSTYSDIFYGDTVEELEVFCRQLVVDKYIVCSQKEIDDIRWLQDRDLIKSQRIDQFIDGKRG